MAATRERWGGRTAFIMAAIGSAVGLGNVWRFPATAFDNGGGAFLIPYFVALLTAGIPIMIIEYALGQRFQQGAPGALARVSPWFRWVGWFALLVGATITAYYVVIMAYSWRYLVASPTVGWARPAALRSADGVVPPDRIIVYHRATSLAERERLETLTRAEAEEGRRPVLTVEEVRRLEAEEAKRPPDQRMRFVPLDKNIAHYFYNDCLGGFEPGAWAKDQHRGDMARPVPSLVFWTAVTWLLIFLIIAAGVKNVGRVVMITVPLPLILLLVLLIRGVTLPGASEGITYYLTPKWESLANPKVWMAAYGQVFFSLTLGFGALIAYASYMPDDSDISNNAFITSFANCATSFFAGFSVFSILGYLAYVKGGVPVGTVVKGGPGLAFVTYPLAICHLPGVWKGLIGSLFFICLLTLGIDSAFSLVEGTLTGVSDALRKRKVLVTGIICCVGFLMSLPFTTRSGLMWLDIVDNWMNNYGLALVGLLECVAVGYFANFGELRRYINRRSEIHLNTWFDLFVKVITPAVLIYLLGAQFGVDIRKTYGEYDQVLPGSVLVAGWGWFFLLIFVALFLGRNWPAFTWVAVGLIAYGLFRFGLEREPAAMGAFGFTLLFGGFATCLWIALRKRHGPRE